MKKTKTLLMVTNVDWFFIQHRMAIAKAALHSGYRIVVLAKDTGRSDEITNEGMLFYNLEITRSGTQLFKELKVLMKMFFLYKKINPNLVYQATMKPVIYGSLIAKIIGIPNVNAISGLGYNFTDERKGFVKNIMIKLMRFSFCKKANGFVFENKDDFKELTNLGIIDKQNRVVFTKGIGVNLKEYTPVIKSNHVPKAKTVVLMPARMLWDKGVKEFVEAALLLKESYQNKVFFKMCGSVDLDNKEGVSKEYLIANKIEGYLEWIGFKKEMHCEYKNADIVVLPSYREGMPAVLLEACAMGKPIITTDAIGCRNCVDHGVNGYKVPVKSIEELASAIQQLIDTPLKRTMMGIASRKKAELEFDRSIVIDTHLKLFQVLVEPE